MMKEAIEYGNCYGFDCIKMDMVPHHFVLDCVLQ